MWFRMVVSLDEMGSKGQHDSRYIAHRPKKAPSSFEDARGDTPKTENTKDAVRTRLMASPVPFKVIVHPG
jgi:hypothetical protein